MRDGEILVEHAARSFRVYPRENRALKDLIFARRHARGSDVWALRDVSFAVEPGSALGLVGRNGSGKTTLLSLIAGIISPTSGQVASGGRVASLLELPFAGSFRHFRVTLQPSAGAAFQVRKSACLCLLQLLKAKNPCAHAENARLQILRAQT